MIKTFLILAMLNLGLIGVPSDAVSSPVTLASIRVEFDTRTFLANVSDHVQSANGKRPSRKLRIACISGCTSPLYFEQIIDDFPLGIYRESDGDDLLITTWVTGTAYAIRIYQLKGTGIQKVFDSHSLEIPVVQGAEISALTISTTSSDQKGGPGGGVSRRQSWRWTGSKFERQ